MVGCCGLVAKCSEFFGGFKEWVCGHNCYSVVKLSLLDIVMVVKLYLLDFAINILSNF